MNNVKFNNRRHCSYKGCSTDRLTTRNGAISFFSFPIKDTERCSMWISKSGREEFRYLTPKELGEKKICELHFDHGMFSNDFKTNLTKRAFPLDWRLSSRSPELIQIEDGESSNECESVAVSEGSCAANTNVVNGFTSNGVCENGNTNHMNKNASILNAALNNGASMIKESFNQIPNSDQSCAIKQLSVATSMDEGSCNTIMDKSTAIPASNNNKIVRLLVCSKSMHNFSVIA
uniref:THAP-type domain-containing protein n=1 Tax=Graphocephala atropunctata TaxID=36148 RepID=A0A1B6MTU6_9HEMI